MPRLLLFMLLLSTLLLGGCVGNKGERIHVRRTPEELARDTASPKNYAQLREEIKQQDEANALTGELKRSEAWLKYKRWRINQITSVRGDTWDNYENERRATLYRHFSDRFSPPPVIEGEPLPGEEPPKSDDEGDEGDEGDEDEGGGADDSDDYGY